MPIRFHGQATTSPKVFGATREQCCRVHETADVLDAMPKSVQAKAEGHLHGTGRIRGRPSLTTGLAMAFEPMMSAQGRWRELDGSDHLPGSIRNMDFTDGIEQRKPIARSGHNKTSASQKTPDFRFASFPITPANRCSASTNRRSVPCSSFPVASYVHSKSKLKKGSCG